MDTKPFDPLLPQNPVKCASQIASFVRSADFCCEHKVKRMPLAQNAELRRYLLSTEDRILVEASPYDRVRGIGLSADDPRANNPEQWQGSNLL